jgi:hypothetical protein
MSNETWVAAFNTSVTADDTITYASFYYYFMLNEKCAEGLCSHKKRYLLAGHRSSVGLVSTMRFIELVALCWNFIWHSLLAIMYYCSAISALLS